MKLPPHIPYLYLKPSIPLPNSEKQMEVPKMGHDVNVVVEIVKMVWNGTSGELTELSFRPDRIWITLLFSVIHKERALYQITSTYYLFLTPSCGTCERPISSELVIYNLVSLCGFLWLLIFLVVKMSLPATFRTTSKLADCFARVWPSESANCNTRLETVGLSRL